MDLRPLVILILLSSLILSGCFGPSEDDDRLDADSEREGWVVEYKDAQGMTVTKQVSSSPYQADTDEDGLDDWEEAVGGSHPGDMDTDGDGLKDGYDVELASGSKTAKKWLAAGLAHRVDEQVVVFLGEWDHQADPLMADTDADGLVDGREVGGFEITVCGEDRIIQTSARQEDTDDDILLDQDELRYGTDPTRADTDEDGVSDLQDIGICGDAHLRFEEFTFTPADGEDRATYSVEVWLQGESTPWRSDPLEAGPGEEQDLAAHIQVVDVADDQGNLRSADFNATGQIFVYRGEGTERQAVDITETAGTALQFSVDFVSGTLRFPDEPVDPTDGTLESSGPGGSVALALSPQMGA